MSELLRARFGTYTFEAKPTKAYAGFADRTYASEHKAIIDLATNEIAKDWLKHCGTGAPSFADIMNYVEAAPDVIEAAVALARFKEINR